MKKILKKIIGVGNIKVIQSIFLSNRGKELIEKRRIFYSQFFKESGSIYFDIGANYGNRIEPIIGLDIKIIAVEPQLECVHFLKRKYGK